MSASGRNDRLIDELRELHLALVHRSTRLRARRTTAPLATGIAARATAIGRELAREAELCVEEVRNEAMIDAVAERMDELRVRTGTLETELGKLAERNGELRAERIRLEARLLAERSAVKKTQQLLEVRLRAAALARGLVR